MSHSGIAVNPPTDRKRLALFDGGHIPRSRKTTSSSALTSIGSRVNVRALRTGIFSCTCSPQLEVVMRVFISILLVLTIAAPAAAQKPTFDIEGVVTDAQQAVLPGATVTLQNVATGLS